MAYSITAVIFTWPLAAFVTSSGMMVTPSHNRCDNGVCRHSSPAIHHILPVGGRARNMGRHPDTTNQFHDPVQCAPVNAGIPVGLAQVFVGGRAHYHRQVTQSWRHTDRQSDSRQGC